MRAAYFLGLCGAALLFFAAPAKADIFLWTDPKTGMRVSFPDDWRRDLSLDRDERLTIRAPLADDYATCHFHARKDGRALIYPYRYLQTITNQKFDESYWDNVMMGYDQPEILFIKNNSPIDKAWATYALVNYSEPTGRNNNMRRMQAVMFAGFYGEQSFLVRCAARQDRFDHWRPMFFSLIRAMELKSAYQDEEWMEYRNFLNDPIYIVNPRQHGTTFIKSGRWEEENLLQRLLPFY